MIFQNLIVSLLMASTIYAQCPRNWWPLNPTYLLTTDVMGGKNIVGTQRIAAGFDRISTTNSHAAFITNANIVIGTALATPDLGFYSYLSFMTIPADTYFPSTTFSITLWLNIIQAPSADFARIFDFAQNYPNLAPGSRTAVALKINNGAAPIPSLVLSNAGAEVLVTSSSGITAATWTFVGISCTVTTSTSCIFYFGSSAVTVLTATATINAASNIIPSTGTYLYNYIGASAMPRAAEVAYNGLINDLKIYSSTLTATQMLTNFLAEKTRVYTCSSTSISPQYFYIVLLALLGSFL